MHSLDREFLERQSISMVMSQALRKLGEYCGKQELLYNQRPALLKTLKEVSIIQSTESSNRIEGIEVDPSRLEPLLNKKTEPKDRPESEVLGYRQILADIHTNYSKFSITPETILSIHKKMYQYTDLPQGVWKTRDNSIEERLPNGQWITRFTPIAASKTPYYMGELCKQFARLWNDESIDRLFTILAFVFDFLCIHPFSDGNGRISRLLTTLLLHQINYDITRFISFEKLIEETKESYYDILHRCSQRWHEKNHSVVAWFDYNVTLLNKAYKQFEERIKTLDDKYGKKTAWIIEIIDHLPKRFKIGDVTRQCPGISRPLVRNTLDQLKQQGILKLYKKGRGSTWEKVD